jgi:hypothetical protein
MHIGRTAIRHLLLACCLTQVIAGCETFSVTTDYDKSVSFATYHTFSWVSQQHPLVKMQDDRRRTEGNVATAVMNGLTRKGFRFVEDSEQADLVIVFSLESWHEPNNKPGEHPTRARIAIDMLDTKLRKPVWHGEASKHISESDRGNVAVINEAVVAILRSFPPP